MKKLSLLEVKVSYDSTLPVVDEQFYCKTTNDGLWYYDRLSQEDFSPNIYKNLLAEANRTIRVWDPYLCAQDVSLFDDIGSHIEIWILTYLDVNQPKQAHSSFLREIRLCQIRNRFSLHIAAIDSQKVNAQLKKKVGRTLPHDRFLFVDERTFLVGSSLRYHSSHDAEGVSSTMIYEVKEDTNRKFLLDEFKSFWSGDKKDKYVSDIDLGGIFNVSRYDR